MDDLKVRDESSADLADGVVEPDLVEDELLVAETVLRASGMA